MSQSYSCVKDLHISINSSQDSNDNNVVLELEKMVESLTKGSPSLYYNSLFKQLILKNIDNAKILYEFLITEHNIQNVKLNTTLTHIKVICLLNKFLDYKGFYQITKNDILYYLNSLRKSELDDPTHKWIGTYNARQMIFSKFFRWLYNQNESDNQKWITPSCMSGIKSLKRKEKSPYKPSDLWTNNDHAIFLKYCPEKRDRCYHSMAIDTSCRPHELLGLKIKDIIFKVSTKGNQYAVVNITRSKTRPRTLPLIFSLPYVKDWINSHPFGNNPDSFLFISLGDHNFGDQLSENALYKIYTRTYKKNYFPKLIQDSTCPLPQADESIIKNLFTKPWTPYIQRHSSLTQKSLILTESALRNHAGWTMSSRMSDVYLNYFGDESSKTLLEIYGIEDYNIKQHHILKSKTCTNCNEPNKPESMFCQKCRMILSYDAYNQTIQDQMKKELEIKELKEKHENDIQSLKEEISNRFVTLILLIQLTMDIDKIKNKKVKQKTIM